MRTKAQAAAPRPHTREVLDIREWATGKIEDTPPAFAKMMDATPRAPGEEGVEAYDSSALRPFSGAEVAEGEFRGGRSPI